MTDEAAELSASALGELGGHGLLVFGLSQPDLDQLVGEELSQDLPHDGVGDPVQPYVNHGVEVVCQPAEVFFLVALKARRTMSSSPGRLPGRGPLQNRTRTFRPSGSSAGGVSRGLDP